MSGCYRCNCSAVGAFVLGSAAGALGLFAILLGLYFAVGFKGWRR